ncbi:MAG TPA: hypothetical protein VM051_03140, partial [Usitatibacter sp.]|nr:hypothetical protein [Usitatibacter sp.]
VYGDLEQRFEPLARPAVPRAEVLDALCETIAGERATVHDGAWGRATLAVCLAMLDSSRTGREIAPGLQVPVG